MNHASGARRPIQRTERIVTGQTINRRSFLKTSAVGAGGLALSSSAAPPPPPARAETVRDRLWIFTCAANSDFLHLRRRSVMTPLEGAFFLDVPNIIVVQSSAQEAPHGRLHPPFAQYLTAMQPLRRIVWSVVGSGGFHSPEETKEVLELARTTPNFVGIMLDDFFTGEKTGKRAQLTLDELASVRDQLRQGGRNLDIFVTLYCDKLDQPIGDYTKLVDVITLWTSDPNQLANLETNFKRVESLFPRHRKMLGCYVVDYGRKEGTPLSWMQLQCETGLRWLQERRIDGIIFLGNTTMDLGFPSVNWTREWIQKVGPTRL